MTNLFKEFNPSTKAEWEARLLADLKGKDLSTLQVNDPIEEISFRNFYHPEDQEAGVPLPGNFPFTRGMNENDNGWKNGARIDIGSEETANRKALMALNSGADLLVFVPAKEEINWQLVLADIQLEFIDSHFVLSTFEEYRTLRTHLALLPDSVQFHCDIFTGRWSGDDFNALADDFKDAQRPFLSVNGTGIQQAGATTWQEIAFSLATGHEYLLRLMNYGFTIDEAAACISFHTGTGARYIYESAKLRALKQGWAHIVSAYNPQHACSHNCRIHAHITHLNKSLADPYTNLLRQTTEALSAANGGAESIVVLPYDYYSVQGSSELAERMALNISSILKEESFEDKVLDPLGGSYSLEHITTLIGHKAWDLFRELESGGGIGNTASLNAFKNAVQEKRSLRIERLKTGADILIGINKYPDPKPHQANWKAVPSYLDLPALILENELNAHQE